MPKMWTPERIQALRKKTGLGYTKFGRLLCPERSIHYTTIYKWEKGLNEPSLTLAAALDKLAGRL